MSWDVMGQETWDLAGPRVRGLSSWSPAFSPIQWSSSCLPQGGYYLGDPPHDGTGASPGLPFENNSDHLWRSTSLRELSRGFQTGQFGPFL